MAAPPETSAPTSDEIAPEPASAGTGASRRSHPGALLALVMIVGGGVITQLLTAVIGVICARMLGVEGRGQVVLVSSLAVMVSQLTLGGSLPNAVTKQLADRGVTARDGLRHLVPQWVLLSIPPAALAGGYFLFVERDTGGSAKYALALAVVISAVQTIATRILIGAMLGEGADLIHVAMTGVLPQAVTALVLGTAYGFGVRWNAVELMAVSIGCALLMTALRLKVLKKPTRREADALDGRELWRLARQTHIGSVGPIDGLSIDRTLVGSLLGSVQLGLYSAAFALAGLSTVLGGCLAMVILPRVTVAQSDPVAERRLVRRWLLMSALLIAAAVLVLEVSARFVIGITFGPKFLAAAACAHWLLLASGLLDFRRVLIAVLQGRNLGGRASVIEFALTPFVVIGILVAAHYDSLIGVGMTMVAVGVLSCTMLGLTLARNVPGRHVARHAQPAARRRPLPGPGVARRPLPTPAPADPVAAESS